jgi:hypothetical protein
VYLKKKTKELHGSECVISTGIEGVFGGDIRTLQVDSSEQTTKRYSIKLEAFM